MEFCPIVPYSMLNQVKNYPMHLILPTELENETYAIFYATLNKYKILDNGAAETGVVSTETLLGWAEAIHADEVVAPDVMRETDVTIKLCKDFFKEYPANQCMMVLQATTLTQFYRILEFAMGAEVKVVALPKLLYKYFGPHGRHQLADTIRRYAPNITIHCLGCTGYPQEVLELQKQGIVRSIDSSAPVVLGLQGIPIDLSTYEWEKSRPEDYFNAPSTLDAEVNLATFTQWCTGK